VDETADGESTVFSWVVVASLDSYIYDYSFVLLLCCPNEDETVSADQKKALVCAPSRALARTGASDLASRGLLDLLRHGLDDLSKVVPEKGRVLLVNDQQALLEEMEQILVANGYEVRSTCRQADAINMANSFFEPQDVTVHANGYWSVTPCPANIFVPRFVMLGLTMPVTLGAELFGLRRRISKLILWGKVQQSEDLEQRREYYDFDVLPTPFDAERSVNDMRSWLAEAWTNNGNLLDAEAHHSDALECHEKALAIDRRCVSAWINKGLCLDELGRWPEAIQCYERAIEINRPNYTPWVRKADILTRMDRFEEAIHCYDAALQLSAESISSWMGRGAALHHLGRYQEALHCYDKVLEIDRATWTDCGRAHVYSDALNSKGASLYRMGHYSDSIECYDKAIALDPKYAQPWYNKGNSLQATKHFDEAVSCYDRAVELDPGHTGTWNNKGICLRNLGRLEEALVCHEKALGCDPPDLFGWYNRALVQEDLGRIQDAISSYENYLAVAPASTDRQVEQARARLRDLKSRIESLGVSLDDFGSRARGSDSEFAESRATVTGAERCTRCSGTGEFRTSSGVDGICYACGGTGVRKQP
jgi:tetratricopeptide (TPR) repeat protein